METQSYMGANIFRRFVATLVDGIILNLTFAVLLFLFNELNISFQELGLKLGFNIITFIGFIYLIAKYARTPGKKFLNLKVLNLDGTYLTYGKSFKRQLSYLIYTIPYLIALIFIYFYIEYYDTIIVDKEQLQLMIKQASSIAIVLGFIVNILMVFVPYFKNDDNRMLHDTLTNTIVIYELNPFQTIRSATMTDKDSNG